MENHTKDVVIMIEYVYNDWGPDIALFTVDVSVMEASVKWKIEESLKKLKASDFYSPQNYVDCALDDAAQKLNATWRYPLNGGTVAINTN